MTRLAALLAVGALLGGCAPLGATPRGYTVTVQLADVLDLSEDAAVTVDGASVGRVEHIRLAGFIAEVRLRLDRSVELPDNALAEVRHTTLLGENDRTIALSPPASQPRGRLSDGDVIALAHTAGSLAVEEALSAFSVLLAGGGLEQLRTISTELGAALKGREPSARAVLRDLDHLVTGLDAQRSDIVTALDSLDRLTRTLAEQRRSITAAVDAIGPGLAMLAGQREQLTAMLTALGRLSTVGGRVIAESRDATLADLQALRPILEQLQHAGTALPRALELLATYPFPGGAGGAISGGVARLYADLGIPRRPAAGPAPGTAAPAAPPTAAAIAPPSAGDLLSGGLLPGRAAE